MQIGRESNGIFMCIVEIFDASQFEPKNRDYCEMITFYKSILSKYIYIISNMVRRNVC